MMTIPATLSRYLPCSIAGRGCFLCLLIVAFLPCAGCHAVPRELTKSAKSAGNFGSPKSTLHTYFDAIRTDDAALLRSLIYAPSQGAARFADDFSVAAVRCHELN